MKKALGVMALATIMLVGCGSNNVDNEEGAPPVEDEMSEEELAEEAAKYENIEVKVIDEARYAFDREADKSADLRDESTDFNVSAFAAIKNTSELPIDLRENVSVDLFSADGSVISKVDGHTADPSPRVLQPGEIGYLAVSEPTGELAELKEIKLNSSPIAVAFTSIPLKADKVKINLDTENYIRPVFEITGVLTNETEQIAQGASIGAGLYDANGKFLAAMQGGIDDAIEPGKSVAFELFDPVFPLDVMKQVKEVKITASYTEEL